MSVIKEIIRETELTNELANGSGAFKVNGTQYTFQGDCSLLAVARAVVEPLVPDGEKYKIHIKELYRPSLDDLQYESNSLTLMVLQNDDFHDTYSDMKSELESHGYSQIDRFREYFMKQFSIKGQEAACAYVNEEYKSTVVIVATIGPQKFHLLCSSVLSLVPYFRKQEDIISEDHKAILQSFMEPDSGKFIALIAKEAKKYDFKTEYIKSALKGFKTGSLERRLSDIRGKLESNKRRIENLLRDIANHSEEARTLRAEETGLVLAIDNTEEKPLSDIFINSKDIEFVCINDGTITFDVSTKMVSFDSDTAERMLDNKHSTFYDPDGVSNPEEKILPEDMKMLMKAIFVDQTLGLNMSARYKLGMDGGISGCRGIIELKTKYPTSYANPHIFHYNCMGDYADQIAATIQSGDYEMSIMMCVASCGSLNVSDSSVMNQMMTDIYLERDDVNLRCVVLPNDDVVTFKEAIEYLKGEHVNE